MPTKRIGALVIGQSPRPDLVAPLLQLLPDCEILQAGALDDLTLDDLPDTTDAIYPLITRMSNGTRAMVTESYVTPKLQEALNRLEANGVAATILLCAGTFTHLNSNLPLFKPFKIGSGILASLNMKSIGLIVPVQEQEIPIQQRWESKGWKTAVWTADLENQDSVFRQQLTDNIRVNKMDCIVLDYVGHPVEQVEKIQKSIEIPVIDLGYLTMHTLVNTL